MLEWTKAGGVTNVRVEKSRRSKNVGVDKSRSNKCWEWTKAVGVTNVGVDKTKSNKCWSGQTQECLKY